MVPSFCPDRHLATIGAEAHGVLGNWEGRFKEADTLPPIPDLEVVAAVLMASGVHPD